MTDPSAGSTGATDDGLRYGTPAARWVIAATVLGSGMAFLDGTVVNVALPAISEDLGASLHDLQWIVDAYLVTLCALLLLGGSLGDRLGRKRVFLAGVGAFTLASVLCAAAPTSGALIAARAVQGVGAALLVPGSLAIIAATFCTADRGRAIGAWSGLAGVTSAVGPFLGGWLVDSVSWRLIFVLNIPLAVAVVAIAVRHVPETKAPGKVGLDGPGAAAITIALGGLAYAGIEHEGPGAVLALVIGVVALLAFVLIERSSSHPMLPLRLFRSRQFTGANLTTVAVYAALGAALFLVVLRLQISMGYSALEAGASLAPFTLIMLVLSPRAGALGQRIGARTPMTIGPLVTALGLVLFSRLTPGDSYVSGVLPAVVVFAMGMALTVAPLTAAVLAAVPEALVGVASGVNNAAARLAGLFAVATLPAIAGIGGASLAAGIDDGFATALHISAVICAAGGVIAFAVVRDTAPTATPAQPDPFAACHDPCVRVEAGAGA